MLTVGIRRTVDGSRLVVAGDAVDKNVIILTSTNLTDWFPVATFTNFTGVAYQENTIATNTPYQFFRAQTE